MLPTSSEFEMNQDHFSNGNKKSRIHTYMHDLRSKEVFDPYIINLTYNKQILHITRKGYDVNKGQTYKS